MSILVLADHDGNKLGGATLCAITAAQQIGGSIELLIAGDDVRNIAAEAAAIPAVTKVLVASAPHLAKPTPEALVALLRTVASGRTHVIAANTAMGKSALPRLAAVLDVAAISDVATVVDEKTFVRPIYAGNALATYQSTDAVKVLTVRTTSFAAATASGGSAPIESLAVPPDPAISRVVSEESSKSDRPELTAARVVISGGRGLGSSEKYRQLLEPLAVSLNAALGASRAAVDAGYVPNDYQVGQTGKIVAPDLYIAIGISGAIQHLAGMKESKVIVAINKDPDAPIFQFADYGLVGDLFQVVPELTAELR
ncbi:MAG TPA: FAD-binding protein [Burkholderiales bacterium]|nr:FAD-binding protein [Burkholderiales bacterium]